MKEIIPKAQQGIVNRTDNTVFRYHGWPSVCKDDRGVLYASASGMRIQHVDPSGKNCLYLSFNEGETWTPPIVVNDSYLDDRDTGIVYMGDGRLLISWFSSPDEENYARFADYEWLPDPEKAMILGMAKVVPLLKDSQTRGGSYVKISQDYGVTWSANIPVPMSAPHGPNRLKDGSLLYLGRIMPGECGVNENRIAAFHSADYGYTWTMRGIVPVPEDLSIPMMFEPHVVELPNGRLLGAIRVHNRPVQPDFTVYTTVSDDGGRTWSMPECIGVDGSPPHLLVHSSGAVICSYARRRGEGDRSERAVVSYDGGLTWVKDYVLNDRVHNVDLGYPATVELRDGSLLTVYYQCWPGDDFCSVLYTKWRLQDRS